MEVIKHSHQIDLHDFPENLVELSRKTIGPGALLCSILKWLLLPPFRKNFGKDFIFQLSNLWYVINSILNHGKITFVMGPKNLIRYTEL
jgi:hypothetical protein